MYVCISNIKVVEVENGLSKLMLSMNPSSSKESGGGGGGSRESVKTSSKVDLLELKLGFGTVASSSSSSLPSSQSTKKSQENIASISLGRNRGFETLNRQCNDHVVIPCPPSSSSAATIERYNNGLWWAQNHNHKQLGLFVSRASTSDERRVHDEYDDPSLPSPLLRTLLWSAFPYNDGSQQNYHCSQRPQSAAGLWFSLRSIINRAGEVLPQVSKAYIRVKNEKVTVLMVKTYLVRKLGLSNQSQVEISCMGQNLLESQELKKVRDEIWLPKCIEIFQSSNQKLVQNSNISSTLMNIDNHLMPLDYGKCCLYIYN